jgi:acetyltransferase
MSTYRLDQLFSPKSVALVGASPRATSVGRAILRNLLAFSGQIHLINPHYAAIEGVQAVRALDRLRDAPDVVVIAAPARSVPAIVSAAGEKGARTAGIRTVEGQVLRENTTMLAMCRELGFEICFDPREADICVAKLRL